MPEKSIKKNFIFNIFYHALTLILPFVTTPYVSRALGVDGVGEYSYSNSIVSYFVLVAVLGTTIFGQRAIGYTQKQIEDRSRAFWEVFILRLITSCVTLIAYILYSCFWAQQASLIINLILAGNILNVICDITWFFQGMEEFGKTVTRSVIFRLVYVVCVFLLVNDPSDLWLYVLLTVGSVVLGNITLWLVLPKYICKVKDVHPFKDIKSVLQLFIPTVATQIYVVLDKSMIGWFSDGYTENGYYEQAEKVAKITLSFITALGTVMIPRISRHYKEGNLELVKHYINKSFRFIWMLAIPTMIGLAVVADFFVPVFFGAGYEKCVVLIPIFSCLTVFIGLSNVTGIQYLIPTGKQNILTITVVVGAIVNASLNAILIPFYSSIGAAIASIVAEFSVTVAGFIYLHRTKQFKISKIIACSWRYWLSGIVMGGAVYLIKIFLPISVWSLIGLIAIGAVVYILSLLIIRDKLFYELLVKSINAVKKCFKRNKKEDNTEESVGIIEDNRNADIETSNQSDESATQNQEDAESG